MYVELELEQATMVTRTSDSGDGDGEHNDGGSEAGRELGDSCASPYNVLCLL
jgi:hypothetical protein